MRPSTSYRSLLHPASMAAKIRYVDHLTGTDGTIRKVLRTCNGAPGLLQLTEPLGRLFPTPAWWPRWSSPAHPGGHTGLHGLRVPCRRPSARRSGVFPRPRALQALSPAGPPVLKALALLLASRFSRPRSHFPGLWPALGPLGRDPPCPPPARPCASRINSRMSRCWSRIRRSSSSGSGP